MVDEYQSPTDNAKAALEEAANESFRAAELTRTIGRLEADRHERKDHAVRRLMLPPAEGEKGLSRTAASEIVNSDPQYRDYLVHLSDKQADLDIARDKVRVATLRARLNIALIEQGVAA